MHFAKDAASNGQPLVKLQIATRKYNMGSLGFLIGLSDTLCLDETLRVAHTSIQGRSERFSGALSLRN